MGTPYGEVGMDTQMGPYMGSHMGVWEHPQEVYILRHYNGIRHYAYTSPCYGGWYPHMGPHVGTIWDPIWGPPYP